MSGMKASFWNVAENVVPRESERSRVQSCDCFCRIHASESGSDHLLIIWMRHDAYWCSSKSSKSSCWKQTARKQHKKGVNETGRLKGFEVKHEVVGAPATLQSDDMLGKCWCSLSWKPGWVQSIPGYELRVTSAWVKGHRKRYFQWWDSVSMAGSILL